VTKIFILGIKIQSSEPGDMKKNFSVITINIEEDKEIKAF
jgi:hypothetical protein